VRARLRSAVDIAAPAPVVWDHVTDWPRQGDWVPQTRVELIDGQGLGGRFRAWTGVGPVGFWDPMTITAWQRDPDGGGRCEVLHRGRVVKGEGEFVVEALGPGRARFVWSELVPVPFGRLGALAWPVVRPLAELLIGVGLRRMRDLVEGGHAG
jgi:hypothetical protein